MSQHVYRPSTFPGSSMDPVERGVLPMRSAAYGSEDMSGFSARNEPISGITPDFTRGYSTSIKDPVVTGQWREHSVGVNPVIPDNPDIMYERPVTQPEVNGISAAPVLSNVLFVDGLPTDCTRREVGHIFRPFIGFKDIKVIHKEPRRSGDKAVVLCFVEFNDANCALTAMEALQGYKFDDKKPNAPVLKIQFAHFPFHPPSEHGSQRIGALNGNNQATAR